MPKNTESGIALDCTRALEEQLRVLLRAPRRSAQDDNYVGRGRFRNRPSVHSFNLRSIDTSVPFNRGLMELSGVEIRSPITPSRQGAGGRREAAGPGARRDLSHIQRRNRLLKRSHSSGASMSGVREGKN